MVLRRLWSETQNVGFVNCNFKLRALAFQSFESRLGRTRENEQEECSLVRLPALLPRFNSRGTGSTTEIHKPSFRVLAFLQSESDSLSVANLLCQFS